MHKLWWSGCKRFTSGHGIAGTVSGVEAAIHCGDELWFGVGMELSERDQTLWFGVGMEVSERDQKAIRSAP